MGGTGGGGEERRGLAGGERYGDANGRVRLWVRLKLDPEGEEGAGVGGAETMNLDALFGVVGCLRSPQERMEARDRWGRSIFGRSSELWRLRRAGRLDMRLRTGGGRGARITSGDGLRGGGESARGKMDMVERMVVRGKK